MKIAASILAIAFLLGLSSIARAQGNGSPYLFTLLYGSFVDGEPDATYGSAPAYIQVGASAGWSCENTDTINHLAETQYYLFCYLYQGPGAGTELLPPDTQNPQYASGYWNGEMIPGQVLDYYLTFLTAGSEPASTYLARVGFLIYDGKTDNTLSSTQDMTVTVN
jgi:hypothetical protein